MKKSELSGFSAVLFEKNVAAGGKRWYTKALSEQTTVTRKRDRERGTSPMEDRKKHWGDRKDGYLIRDLDAMHYVMPHIYPNRCDNEAYISQRVDLTAINAYLAQKNESETEFPYTIFHLIVAAIIKTITLRPKMNRFIANKTMYQRKEVSAAFVVKKQFNDGSEEGLAFLHAKPEETLDTLHRRVEKLNSLRLASLHYTNSLGTDLTIRLPQGHVWEAGNDVTPKGQTFIANIPTEEIYTAPLKTGIDGVVYSAMPLVNDGNIIDKFHFVVKEGKIVEAHAEKGEDSLLAAISLDEGARYFGEVALVPYDSPISNQKILYYNTLFDENAACHLAFGEAYPCIEGGRDMTKEELTARGLNDSITHVDFMVGTPDLSIVGTTQDGRQVPIFVDGNFAPDI